MWQHGHQAAGGTFTSQGVSTPNDTTRRYFFS
jgi:hypothetical protein